MSAISLQHYVRCVRLVVMYTKALIVGKCVLQSDGEAICIAEVIGLTKLANNRTVGIKNKSFLNITKSILNFSAAAERFWKSSSPRPVLFGIVGDMQCSEFLLAYFWET